LGTQAILKHSFENSNAKFEVLLENIADYQKHVKCTGFLSQGLKKHPTVVK